MKEICKGKYEKALHSLPICDIINWFRLFFVRETGGLKDSITPYNKFTGEGLGFTFRQYNHIDMLGAVDRAIEAYRQSDIWKGLMKNAMSAHFTWEKSAGKYIELYERLSER